MYEVCPLMLFLANSEAEGTRENIHTALIIVFGNHHLYCSWLYVCVLAGGAIDLFYRYGFFSLSVRVVPRDDPGSWLVREPTSRIFDDNSIRRTERPGPNSFVEDPIEVRTLNHMFSLFYFCPYSTTSYERRKRDT